MNGWIIALCCVAGVGLAGVTFTHQPSFGRLPRGERKARMEQSWHYKDGKWQNEDSTATFSAKRSEIRDMRKRRSDRLRPTEPVTTVQTDISTLPRDRDWMLWFGHSAYLFCLEGKLFLVDPALLSGSPVGFINRPFDQTYSYTPDDLPNVDYLIITHDHWDHLDYKTVKQLRPRIGHVITPLGVGAHLERWKFSEEQIVERDWYEDWNAPDSTVFHFLPARHFSGRGLRGNRTLWGSFLIERGGRKVYVGGDSGYGRHFRWIGEHYADIDLAVLENGQYDTLWSNIHTMPQYLGREAKELGAQHVVTVHHSRFALANHDWDEPLRNELDAALKDSINLSVLTIGQPVFLDDMPTTSLQSKAE